jgi:2-(1,2-epoxy-1,2-dihydrophenyl)acetyl-CoA isomerase
MSSEPVHLEMDTEALITLSRPLEASVTNDYGGQLEPERKVQIQPGQTSDFKKGVAAFIEKRLPKFMGG